MFRCSECTRWPILYPCTRTAVHGRRRTGQPPRPSVTKPIMIRSEVNFDVVADQDAEPLETVIRRLKKERDEADARYNEALTAVDQALHAPPAIPQPPPAFDDHQIAALNNAWNIIPGPPSASGFRQRIAGFVWGVIGPYLQRQLALNSLIVDHINRNTNAARNAHRVAEQTADALRDQLAALAQFETRLVQYFQQITGLCGYKRSRQCRGRTRPERRAQWSCRQRRQTMGINVTARAADQRWYGRVEGRA